MKPLATSTKACASTGSPKTRKLRFPPRLVLAGVGVLSGPEGVVAVATLWPEAAEVVGVGVADWTGVEVAGELSQPANKRQTIIAEYK
jgi:hypothetical protein